MIEDLFAMRLNSLSVYKNGELLREVTFRDGLNIIVNRDSGVEKTGNSVGKSTLSRLLDYIFLSSGEDIYTEPEFNKHIPEVVDFISTNQVFVELDFTGFDGQKYLAMRELIIRENKSRYWINRKSVAKKEFEALISKEIFGLVSDKPSLRTVSHKFIRNTNEKMQNTTRFLNQNSKADVYDQLYLFLFGFSGLNLVREKSALNNQIATKTKHLSAYRNPHKETALQKMIAPLRVEEERLQGKIEDLDFSESHEGSVQELVTIQRAISEFTIEYSGYLTRVDYLKRSIEKLKGNAAKVDGQELSSIYANAGVSVSSDLKRSYEDLVAFHNKIIANKINLITADLLRCEEISENVRLQIEDLHIAESKVFKHIKEPAVLKSIGDAYNELAKVKEQIAATNALLDKIESTKLFIASLESRKAEIIRAIANGVATFDNNVSIFNEDFSALSKIFYGEIYLFDLSFDAESERCIFEIASVSPNSTGGKKKGELSAFDLAYIKFVERTGLKRPRFVVHDSIEDVDAHQVFDIFNVANSSSGQYIVAVLSDKISDKKFEALREAAVILELSDTDKFFRI